MAETHSLQDLRQQAPVAAKVFVQRDYTSGTICQFQTKFPAALETRIDKQQFEDTIRKLNSLYAEAEKLGGRSYLEGCLACLTAYTIFLCMETHYEKVLKKIANYIQDQNDKIYAPRGLLLIDPIERGLRVNKKLCYCKALDKGRRNLALYGRYFRPQFHTISSMSKISMRCVL
uniref:Golgin subfamily A member 7 n=1 Tax=Paramormyrops kingsleyae TaxID=1676925 RepID=A0A3B3SYP7_9TELE